MEREQINLSPWRESESCSVVSDSLRPHGLYSPWNSPGQNTGVDSLSLSPEDLHNPGIEPRSPTLHVVSLTAEPPGKPKNTGVGSQFPSQGDLPSPGIKPGFPTLQADSLTAEPPGKPKNTEVGSLSLHQGIFPI